MTERDPHKSLMTLLGNSINTLMVNPVIFYPYLILGFIQLLALEVLYFAPQAPLSSFFGPIIRRLWSESFLHYPLDLVLLPKLYYYAQIFIYIFIGGFLTAMLIQFIAAINHDRKLTLKAAFKETLPRYIHIVIYSLISFAAFFVFSKFYSLLVKRAMIIRSESGIFFWIKKTVIFGEPYANFLFGVFITALLAFVLPLIVLEKRKVFSAIFLNFKYLWRSFWFMFFVILFPTLIYIPILLLRTNIALVMEKTFPGAQVWSLILSIVLTLIVDAIVFTSVTTYYLFKKELQ